MKELTARKARFLWKILVKDNEAVTGIEISYGTTGMGGSNCSDDLEDRAEVYSLEELRKSKPIHLYSGEELCAVIGDHFYLRSKEKKEKEKKEGEGRLKWDLQIQVYLSNFAYRRYRPALPTLTVLLILLLTRR